MTEVFQSFSTPLYNVHDAIIQTLDRFLGYDNRGYPQLYPADVYEAALNTVTNSRIIYSPLGIHPDPYAYDLDPENAVKEIGGRFAGKILQPYVDKTGHPTTKGKLALEPDPELEDLIANGKLSLSPSVFATYDETGTNVITVRFQNLLIFPEIPGGPVVPGDPGTIFLNTKPNQGTIMTETIEKPVIDPAITAQLQELAQQFSVFKSEIAATKSEAEGLKAQLSAKDEELAKERDEIAKERETFAQFTAKLEEEKQAAVEREFQGLIHDPLFPEGLLKAENAETVLREEFTVSPAQFTRRVLSVAFLQNKFLDKSGEQGQQFTTLKTEESEIWTKGKSMFEKLGLKPEDIQKVI